MCEGVMKHLKTMKLDALEEEDTFKLKIILHDIQLLFLEFAIANPAAMCDFSTFKKVIIVKLLSTNSDEHKEYGQEVLHDLIESIHNIRHTTRAFEVQEAGFDFVNGTYELSENKCDSEGYIIPGVDVSYEKVDQTSGKKMMLFLDKSFLDGNTTWCLSEEHDDDGQPEYTDYYTAIGSFVEGPPMNGWELAEGSEHPTPIIDPLDEVVEVREEHNSMKEDLAKWFIEKKIPDLVLNANVCSSTSPSNPSTTAKVSLALDAYAEGSNMMSAKMANLFVSILPSLRHDGHEPSAIHTNLNRNINSPKGTEVEKAAIEAAKARLASAERWEESTSKSLKSAQNALMNAKTEHEAAKKEAEEARKYLTSIDSSAVRLKGRHNRNSSSVNFDEDTSTVTYDEAKPSSL